MRSIRRAPQRPARYKVHVSQQSVSLSVAAVGKRSGGIYGSGKDLGETNGMNTQTMTHTLTITRTITNTRTSTNFCVRIGQQKKQLSTFGATTPRKPQANRRTYLRSVRLTASEGAKC